MDKMSDYSVRYVSDVRIGIFVSIDLAEECVNPDDKR